MPAAFPAALGRGWAQGWRKVWAQAWRKLFGSRQGWHYAQTARRLRYITLGTKSTLDSWTNTDNLIPPTLLLTLRILSVHTRSPLPLLAMTFDHFIDTHFPMDSTDGVNY